MIRPSGWSRLLTAALITVLALPPRAALALHTLEPTESTTRGNLAHAVGLEEPKPTIRPEDVRILVVEDDDLSRKLIVETLREVLPGTIRNSQIYGVADAQDAVTWIRVNRPQFVMTDYLISGGTGRTVAEAAIDADPSVATILASAMPPPWATGTAYRGRRVFDRVLEVRIGWLDALPEIVKTHLLARLTAGLEEGPDDPQRRKLFATAFRAAGLGAIGLWAGSVAGRVAAGATADPATTVFYAQTRLQIPDQPLPPGMELLRNSDVGPTIVTVRWPSPAPRNTLTLRAELEPPPYGQPVPVGYSAIYIEFNTANVQTLSLITSNKVDPPVRVTVGSAHLNTDRRESLEFPMRTSLTHRPGQPSAIRLQLTVTPKNPRDPAETSFGILAEAKGWHAPLERRMTRWGLDGAAIGFGVGGIAGAYGPWLSVQGPSPLTDEERDRIFAMHDLVVTALERLQSPFYKESDAIPGAFAIRQRIRSLLAASAPRALLVELEQITAAYRHPEGKAQRLTVLFPKGYEESLRRIARRLEEALPPTPSIGAGETEKASGLEESPDPVRRALIRWALWTVTGTMVGGVTGEGLVPRQIGARWGTVIGTLTGALGWRTVHAWRMARRAAAREQARTAQWLAAHRAARDREYLDTVRRLVKEANHWTAEGLKALLQGAEIPAAETCRATVHALLAQWTARAINQATLTRGVEAAIEAGITAPPLDDESLIRRLSRYDRPIISVPEYRRKAWPIRYAALLGPELLDALETALAAPPPAEGAGLEEVQSFLRQWGRAQGSRLPRPNDPWVIQDPREGFQFEFRRLTGQVIPAFIQQTRHTVIVQAPGILTIHLYAPAALLVEARQRFDEQSPPGLPQLRFVVHDADELTLGSPASGVPWLLFWPSGPEAPPTPEHVPTHRVVTIMKPLAAYPPTALAVIAFDPTITRQWFLEELRTVAVPFSVEGRDYLAFFL